MFPLVSHWRSRNCHPIGIDFGTHCLRMAQVQSVGDDARLVAAASIDVPAIPAEDRLAFLVDVVPALLAEGGFHGRQAALALPIASSFVQHVSLPADDRRPMADAVADAVRSVLPIDADDLLIRPQRLSDDPASREVVAIGSTRSGVVRLVQAAQSAGLDVVSMNTETESLPDFYTHVYRRQTDREQTACLIDIGAEGTRLAVVREGRLAMAFVIPIGGFHLTRAVAAGLNLPLSDAACLRLKHARAEAAAVAPRERNVLFVAPTRVADDLMLRERARVDACCAPTLRLLREAIDARLAAFETSAHGRPIDRLIFLGGESNDRRLCESIARSLGITAFTGDPLLRMGRVSDICAASGIDRRAPQPAWAVAIGMSLGPNPNAVRPDPTRQASDPLSDRR